MATMTMTRPKVRAGVLYPHAQWWFLLAMMVTWLGFSHTYFAVVRTEPLLHHVHGALMGGWIGLLVVQPILYQRGRLRLHRLLGRWGAFGLVPAIVVCGGLMVRAMVRGTYEQLPKAIVGELAFLDVGSLVLFVLFVGLSIGYGRTLALHARYIVCTVLLLMPPALGRALFLVPGMHVFRRNVHVALVLMDVVLLLLMVDDWRRERRVRAAYPVALVLFTGLSVAGDFAAGWTWWGGVLGWVAGQD